jgi:hypothetical protein
MRNSSSRALPRGTQLGHTLAERLRSACLATAALALPVLAAGAQEPTPDRDIVVFTFAIQGQGSDPSLSPSQATELSFQNWRYERLVTGWFEVETKRRQVGRGAERRTLIEYTFPRGGAHQVAGVRRDWARNSLRELGEADSFADYEAEETYTAERELELKQSFTFSLDLRATPVWTRMLAVSDAFTQLEQNPRYAGSAAFKPGPAGGFGAPWRYVTDDPARRVADRANIEVRYHPGRTSDLWASPELWRSSWPAAFDGQLATGHVEIELAPPPNARGIFQARAVIDWSVHAELADVELEVRSTNYETWRPTATDASSSPAREPGAPLYLTAELRKRDRRSKAPLPRVERFHWKLVDTSREPGITLNRPYESQDTRPDLELVAGDLTPPKDDEGQVLDLRGEGPRSEVAVFPYDWGGFATLRVEAQLEDGRTIEGFLLGAPGAMGRVKDIPIPASPPGSKIAVSWLRRYCPSWKNDADDVDAIPAGAPGVDGDGFTVYEEYRGVHWNLAHRSMDPMRKELFVRHSPYAFEAAPGLALFRRISGLSVEVTQFPEDLPMAESNRRVVNVNVGRGASNGPQTALYVEEDPVVDRPNDGIAAGSRPATVPVILCPRLEQVPNVARGLRISVPSSGSAKLQQAIDHMIAMALFQACGVDRPGASDKIRALELLPPDATTGAPARYVLDGVPVRIENADGTDRAEPHYRFHLKDVQLAQEFRMPVPVLRPFRLLVGARGGAHSGPIECLMRDCYADLYATGYVFEGLPVYRWTTSQRAGTALGSTRQGTGFNAADHPGGSWFGDSRVATPANRQLVVRDSAR